ncbi:MAG: cell division protein FtsI [Myxococcaceae bacterium]|nr:cell division protein FtsI [Myxococcaceae bacterium]
MKRALLGMLWATAALAQVDGGPTVPSRLTDPPLATAQPLAPERDLLTLAARGDDGRLWAPHPEGIQPLTIAPLLQKELTDLLKLYQTPYAAVVAIEPATGRVLAMAEHSEVDPGLRGLCTKALYPAASIFKIVTAAALLEQGIEPDATTCFHGGKRKLTPRLLEDSDRDSRCDTMSSALASSSNVVFGKLAQQHLDAAKLSAMAKAWRFNTPVPFPVPTDVSLAGIPDDGFGLAQAGAGFGDVFLSPLHGALLAAAAANGGVWRAPVLFECDAKAAPGEGERVLSPKAATQLQAMLEQTVQSGTARRIFHERGASLSDAAGKTGSLADKKPFRDYSWFVGYAPASDPKIAVAAVIVNDPYWRIRATWLGREAMRLYLNRLVPRASARAAAVSRPAPPGPAPGTAGSEPAPPVPEAVTR